MVRVGEFYAECRKVNWGQILPRLLSYILRADFKQGTDTTTFAFQKDYLGFGAVGWL